MSSVPLVDSPPGAHEHEWHVASVDNEPGGPVTEYLCSACSAVMFQ